MSVVAAEVHATHSTGLIDKDLCTKLGFCMAVRAPDRQEFVAARFERWTSRSARDQQLDPSAESDDAP